MKKSNYINFPLALKIQLFADEENDNGSPQEEKIDYKALYEKTKAEKDKASKEASDFKKQLREKETAEEAQKREQQEKQNEIDNIIMENQKMKFEKSLTKDNAFTSEEANRICEAKFSNNNDDFTKILSDIVKAKVEAKETELRNEFRRNAKFPGGTSGNDSIDEDVQSLIDKNKNNASTKAREYFLKR